jgi:hypothetical protein
MRIWTLAAMRGALLLAGVIPGGCDVGNSRDGQFELRWEWPAERRPDQRLLVRVTQVKSHGGGMLGMGNSPSVQNLPDPVDVYGEVVGGSPEWRGRTTKLVAPRAELAGIASGDSLALGLSGRGICICAAKAPAGLNEQQLTDWLAAWHCGSGG